MCLDYYVKKIERVENNMKPSGTEKEIKDKSREGYTDPEGDKPLKGQSEMPDGVKIWTLEDIGQYYLNEAEFKECSNRKFIEVSDIQKVLDDDDFSILYYFMSEEKAEKVKKLLKEYLKKKLLGGRK